MTGIILYNSIYRPQSFDCLYILHIPQYWIVRQLSERRSSVLLKLTLPSVEWSAEKPKTNYSQPLWEKCLSRFPLTILVISFHQISQHFGIHLQIRNEAEVPSVCAKHGRAAMVQGFQMGHEALQGSRTGSLPALGLTDWVSVFCVKWFINYILGLSSVYFSIVPLNRSVILSI